MSRVVSSTALRKYGIKSIKKQIQNSFISYIIEMSENGENIIIQDLIDVRYDFVKDNLRDSDPNEISRIKKEIKLSLSIVDKISKIVYPDQSAQRPSKC